MNRLAKVRKKKRQMNLQVHFYHKEKCCVVTRNYNSEFLGKTSVRDLYERFVLCLSEIEPNKLLQVSSDGPNVNLAFLNILNRFRQDKEQPHLVNIGTCGLHTLHNAFKNGEKASDWNTNKLSFLYKIFDESPRRADYEKLTMAQFLDHPLQICLHRLVENQNVARKAQKYARKLWKF